MIVPIQWPWQNEIYEARMAASALGLDPFDIVHSIERLIRSLWNLGFDAFRWLWRYFLLGAVIVIPVWILLRLFNAPRGK